MSFGELEMNIISYQKQLGTLETNETESFCRKSLHSCPSRENH